MKFNGIAAPLAGVSPNQINAQVPSGIQGSASANVVVSGEAGSSDALKAGTAITLPFTLNWTGGANDSLVTVQLIAHVAGQLASPRA